MVWLYEIGCDVGELVLLDVYFSECWWVELEFDFIVVLWVLLVIVGYDLDVYLELDSWECIFVFLCCGGSVLGSLLDVVFDGVVCVVIGIN